MQTAERLVNRTEELVFKELSAIASDNGLKVFPKMRLQDVILKGKTVLLPKHFEYYTRSHFDFVLANTDFSPVMAIEYDGPHHQLVSQIERDEIKNMLCRDAGLPILRINANHVLRTFRGMTLLRWIVEVRELEKAFYDAQERGSIPIEEPFDPLLIDSLGKGRRFPYWLSVAATQQINSLTRNSDSLVSKGWSNLTGYDEIGNIFELSFLYVGDQVHWSKTGVRQQDADFPILDLAQEVAICELWEQVELNQPIKLSQFEPVHDRFLEKYRPGSSTVSGHYPFNRRSPFSP
jgi:uncharacterized protein DUF2726